MNEQIIEIKEEEEEMLEIGPESITENYLEDIPHRSESVSTNDDIKLKTLLRLFELETILPDLKSARITFKNLKYLDAEDIKEVIRPVGLRAEFREKLFAFIKYEKELHSLRTNYLLQFNNENTRLTKKQCEELIRLVTE